MAVDLSALGDAQNKAVSLGNLILVTPQKTVGYQPQNAPAWKKDTSAQPKALVFNYEGEQIVSLKSDITDHFVEDNSAVQDQWALKPETVSTQGFVGELNDISPFALLPLKFAAEKLTSLAVYNPGLSTSAILAYNTAFQLYQTGKNILNAAQSVWSTINGDNSQSVINGAGLAEQGSNQTQQQIYFQQFFAYWRNRTLFTVQTPWAVFQDMAIQDLQAIQDAETRVITDFHVTFKIMRFASTIQSTDDLYDVSSFLGRAFNQGSKEVDLGSSPLTTSAETFSSKVG